MIGERLSRQRHARQGHSPQPQLMECKFSQRPSHDQYPVPKPFPNNYTSLALHPEYMPNESPIYMGSGSTLMPASGTDSSGTYLKYTPSQEMRLAGMKIFATIMLNAWRRRRDDVKRLLVKVEELKKGSMKAKNQIHVYNTLFRVEQKRNDELACQLKRSLESIIQAKSSCEGLTTSVISLKADKALLEQELQNKYKELDAINDILNQTKSELFHSMVEQRNLRSALVKEQRSVQSLENHKNKLINELYQLGNENRQVEDKYCAELEKKNIDLDHTNAKVRELEFQLAELKTKATTVDECLANDGRLRQEIDYLQERVRVLQGSLQNTFGSRLAICWHKTLYYHRKTLHWAQLFAYILLPAMPAPHMTYMKTSLFPGNLAPFYP